MALKIILLILIKILIINCLYSFNNNKLIIKVNQDNYDELIDPNQLKGILVLNIYNQNNENCQRFATTYK